MPTFKSLEVLENLQADVRGLIAIATLLRQEDPADLLDQPAPGSWSVIQVLEHLNTYSDYYIPGIRATLLSGKPAKEHFKPGWLGGFFTKMMRPTAEGVIKNKMKTPAAHRPSTHGDAKPVIDKFIHQQHEWLALLDTAKTKDIGALRIPITISKLIRLKVGDTFRFNIAHEQRHFIQLGKALNEVKRAKDRSPVAHLAV